jgi:hypothetical protein
MQSCTATLAIVFTIQHTRWKNQPTRIKHGTVFVGVKHIYNKVIESLYGCKLSQYLLFVYFSYFLFLGISSLDDEIFYISR